MELDKYYPLRFDGQALRQCTNSVLDRTLAQVCSRVVTGLQVCKKSSKYDKMHSFLPT